MTISDQTGYSPEELGLAIRNPGMQLEGLRYPITPIGMHYLFIHFDVPELEERTYRLTVDGAVRNRLELSLQDLRAYPAVHTTSVMECAGTGRAHLTPRPISAPWHDEPIGCAEWTGVRLNDVLHQAGVDRDAVEVLFTGYDRGLEDGIDAPYQRSLSLTEASGDDLILAYEMNGQPLPPTHGFPLRLIVPGWYGMAQVKWLKQITVISEPFDGLQQKVKYRYRNATDEPGTPVSRIRPRAVMVPPGMPDMISRSRHTHAGRTLIRGRAWSGFGAIARVEFSSDGGRSWVDADLDEQVGDHGWTGWSCTWDASEPGEYVLCVRATDSEGHTQPMSGEAVWNAGGYGVNVAQHVAVMVDDPL